MYWKMTNLCSTWRDRIPFEAKNYAKRSGHINWVFLKRPQGRAVSVYSSGRGFTVKIQDNHTHR